MGCFIFWFSNIADRNIRVQFGAASVQFHIVSAMLVSGRFLVYLCSYCLWYVGKWERHMVWFVQVEGHVNRIDKKSHHLITSFSFLLFFLWNGSNEFGGIESKRNKYISRKNNPRFKHKSLIFWRFENKHWNRSHSLYVNTTNINFICITLMMMYRWYCYRNCLT